jgi:type II secretory pathway pseudopilin PulG
MTTTKQSPSRVYHRAAGFTLVEILIAVACATLLIGALIVGEVTLLRTFDAGDRYSASEMSAQRVVDYVEIDLRKAFKVKKDTNSGAAGAGTTFTSGTLTLDGTNAITLTEYNCYASNDSSSVNYRNLNPLVYTNGSLTYGLASGTSTTPLYVRYKQAYNNTYGSTCIVRDEFTSSGTSSRVIAEKVDNLQINIEQAGTTNTGHSIFKVTAWFVPSFSKRSGVTAKSYSSSGNSMKVIVADTVNLKNPQQ